MKITQYPKNKLGTESLKIKYSEWSCDTLIAAVTHNNERIWAEDLESLGFGVALYHDLRDSPKWDISLKRWLPW